MLFSSSLSLCLTVLTLYLHFMNYCCQLYSSLRDQRPKPPERVATLTGNSMELLYSHKLLLQFCLLLTLHFSSPLLISSAYTVPDKYFVVCGRSSNVLNGPRVFVGDRDFSAGKGKAIKSSDSSGTSALYQTARVYRKTSSYKFKINKNGTYVVRLHFFAFSSHPELSDALFNVWASGFLLLTNYGIKNVTTSPRIEEFLLTIPEGDFKIFFIPSQVSSLAFVNAIEVFLAPDEFIPDSTARITSTGGNVTYSGLSSQVLHTIHRINVGGDYINVDNLWRNWKPDDRYLLQSSTASNKSYSSAPNYETPEGVYIAPELVYGTAKRLNANGGSDTSAPNVTWSFPVNKDAKHFVRVHFCDIVSKTPDDLWFNFYINRNFSKKINPYSFIQLLAAPFHLDFVVDSDNSRFMNVSVGLLGDSRNPDAFLNGLEIMEFMKNSSFIPEDSESESNKNSPVIIGSVSGGAFVILALILGIGLKCRKKKPDLSPGVLLYGGFSSNNRLTKSSTDSAQYLNLSLKMSLAEIRHATENFKVFIGEGGFGKVYKGDLRNGTKVAVKRGASEHGQGIDEFQREILVFSHIRHRHLVALVGYCAEGSEMILVYEFMENGPLRDHLYHTKTSLDRSSKPKLSWKQRLEICIGAAKGLEYLHTAQTGRIIHRDVKSTNILLDENYVAKVADFGLSKLGPHDPDHSTMGFRGSFGYFDPEYVNTLQLTEKSDVYSFGVVLFEVLCARPALDESLPGEEANLADWAMQRLREGQLEKIIDPVLAGKIKPSSLRKFVEIAEKCLKEKATQRPSMQKVVYDLMYALQLQESAADSEAQEYSKTDSVFGVPFPVSWDVSIQEDDDVSILRA